MPVLVDIREVAAHLGVTVRHVRRLVAERRIPYVKWGNLLRFDPAEVAEWVRDKCVEPYGPGPPRCASPSEVNCLQDTSEGAAPSSLVLPCSR